MSKRWNDAFKQLSIDVASRSVSADEFRRHWLNPFINHRPEFLHRHPSMEAGANLDDNHVIVDYELWRKTNEFLLDNPEIMKKIQEYE